MIMNHANKITTWEYAIVLKCKEKLRERERFQKDTETSSKGLPTAK